MNRLDERLQRVAMAALLSGTLAAGMVAGAQPAGPDRGRPSAGDEGAAPQCEHGGGRGMRGDRRPPRFEDLDKDGDGKLSASEAENIPPVREKGLASFDKNHDGYLDKEELPPPPQHGPRGEGGGPRGEFGGPRGDFGGPRGERDGERGGPGGPRGHRPPSFAELDTNGDGKLSAEEAADIPPVREEGFKHWDKNSDGYLSKDELPAPPEHGRGEGPEGDGPGGDRRGGHRPPSFEDADLNGDGKLSRSEATDIPPVRHEGFEAFDEDKDGFLTKNELPPPPDFGPEARNHGDGERRGPHHGGPGRDHGDRGGDDYQR